MAETKLFFPNIPRNNSGQANPWNTQGYWLATRDSRLTLIFVMNPIIFSRWQETSHRTLVPKAFSYLLNDLVLCICGADMFAFVVSYCHLISNRASCKRASSYVCIQGAGHIANKGSNFQCKQSNEQWVRMYVWLDPSQASMQKIIYPSPTFDSLSTGRRSFPIKTIRQCYDSRIRGEIAEELAPTPLVWISAVPYGIWMQLIRGEGAGMPNM